MNCTYSAQGYLLCPTDMNKKVFNNAHYSTIGFQNDAKAGLFIEPFQEQYSSLSPAEFFAVKQTNVPLPSWVTDPKGQFASSCKSCTIDSSSCQGGQENKCNLSCKCSSCVNGTIVNKPIVQSVTTNGGSPQYYCGGNQYSTTQCTPTQISSLTCTQEKSKFAQRKIADTSAMY